MKEFKLVPFVTCELGEAIDLQVEIDWSDDGSMLLIQFGFVGAIDRLKIPPVSDAPQRKTGLWETTCFECFLGSLGQENYWEINLSPSGDWNVFRLDGYRKNLREERAIETLPVLVKRQGDRMTIEVTLDVRKLGLCRDAIELSATSVLEEITGEEITGDISCDISYWAIAHTGAIADFHLRNSFVISGLG